MTKIYKVGKVANPVDLYTDDVYMYGDVTNMTQGEFNQYLEAQRFRLLAEHHGGIANYDAMAESIAPTSPVKVGVFPTNVQANVMKFMRRVSGMTKPAFLNYNDFNGTQKKPANTMGSVLTDALKPIINWIFSFMIPKAAPFFLYVYLDNPYAKGILLAKKAKQTLILQKIASTAGIPYENLKASVKSALYGILGKSPVDWLNDIINAKVTPTGSNYTATAAETAAKDDKIGPGTSTTSAKGDKIGNPAAGLAAIVPFIPLILGAIAAVASIASKLLETVPELVGKDQLSDSELNFAKPDPLSDFDDIDSGSQNPGSSSTSQQMPEISTGMLLGGAGLLIGGYFLLKK